VKLWVAVLFLLASPLLAHDVEGWVYAPDGTPVSGTAVTAYLAEGSAEEEARKGAARKALAAVKSGEDGHFRLTALPDSVIELKVEAAGFGPTTIYALVDDTPLTVTVDPKGTVAERPAASPERSERAPETGSGSISGVVRLGGKPLAGVPLLVQGLAREYVAPIRVVTDAKGRYHVSGLLPLRHVVVVADGLAPRIRPPQIGQLYEEGREPQSPNLEKERSAVVDVELVRAPMIAGRVVDAEGKGVRGAHVQVILAGRSSLEFLYDGSAERTFADGRYAVAAPYFGPEESAVVAVTRPLHSTFRSKWFPLGTGSHRIDVTLPPFHAVTLRVVDAERKPVPKALIGFAASEEMVMHQDIRILLMPPYSARAVRANEAGEAVLQLAAGTYDFAAAAEGFQRTTLPGRTVARPVTVDVPLRQAYALRGRVHRNGRGVSGVQVSIVGSDGAAPVSTGADGTFEIGGLARGKVRLMVYKNEELINRILQVEVPSKVDVALPPAGTLRGRVVDAATREPVREFFYSLEALEDTSDDVLLQRGGVTADGTFQLTLSAGTYRIGASSSGYTPPEPVEVRVSEREPAEVEIALDRGGTLTGRVTDENGSPVRDAEVYAAPAGGERMDRRSSMRAGSNNARSGEDGTFTVTGIEPGPLTVTVRKDGFVPFRKSIQADGALMTIEVPLTRGLSIRGLVTRAGKPVAEAQVSATTAAVGGAHQPATTDAGGRFVLQGLIAARYTLSAYKDDGHTEVRDVDPLEQREIAISLDPKPRGVIYGTITGLPAGLRGKIVRRSVFATNEETGAEGIIDDAGNYRIENAPLGKVWIAAQVMSPNVSVSSERKQVDVTAGQPVRADLEISSDFTVRGKVTHEGRPVSAARVVFSNEQGMNASAVTGADGTYELAVPAPGTYHLFVHAEAFAMVNSQSIRTIRGGETIDVDLREQTVEGTVVDAATREPIAGAVVTLVPENAVTQSVLGETITDANGRFRLLTAASGANRVMASAHGYAQLAERVTLGGTRIAPVALALQPGSELRVRTLDARTGTPLEAHLVIALPGGSPLPVRFQRSADGETHVFSLAPGEYVLTAVVHGYKTKVVTVRAPGKVDVGLE